MLGGTFDPPHLGHLALARHALRELALDRVLLMPARRSPHKPATPADNAQLHAGAAQRLEMCRLIAGEGAHIDVSDLELRREGPSYTVDTLRELHAAHPHTSLTFILGADVARTLPAWREPRQLLALAELAVAVRSGTAERDVREALGSLLEKQSPPRARARVRGGEDARGGSDVLGGNEEDARGGNGVLGGNEDRFGGNGVRFLSMPPVEISSSLVRERVHRGESVLDLVGACVAAYIEEHGLYRARLAGASPR